MKCIIPNCTGNAPSGEPFCKKHRDKKAAALARPRAAVGEREAAIQMLRDCAHHLTNTASHHGQYAAIDQDKIDGLRDAVRDFDALQPPPAKVEG